MAIFHSFQRSKHQQKVHVYSSGYNVGTVLRLHFSLGLQDKQVTTANVCKVDFYGTGVIHHPGW